MTSRFWIGIHLDDGGNHITPDNDEGLTKTEASSRRQILINTFKIPKEKIVLIAVYEEECLTSQKKSESNIILQ